MKVMSSAASSSNVVVKIDWRSACAIIAAMVAATPPPKNTGTARSAIVPDTPVIGHVPIMTKLPVT